MPNLVSHVTGDEVAQLLASPRVDERLGGAIGKDVRAVSLSPRGDTYRVSGSGGDFIVRFAGDAARLAALRREERIVCGLRGRVTLGVPDTQVVDDLEGCPPFAIHRMIPGEPLTTETYLQPAPPVQERLVADLARFFRETHAIPLETACEWLEIPLDAVHCPGAPGGCPEGGHEARPYNKEHFDRRTIIELASTRGKPAWFGPHEVEEMRPQLAPLIDDSLARLFEDTVRRFDALPVDPGFLVFGHGDIHGYNVAVGEDEIGAKIAGVFDLECAGILDIHEDLFRLSLVSEEMLDRVIAAYHARPGPARTIDRGRIAIYYRAFLFYLMVGRTGEGLDHLKRLMRQPLAG